MHEDFWQARWARDEIGFHLDEVNPYLLRYWSQLSAQPGERVLVPLCGKTLDLRWLAAQGLQVLGVELSRKAIEDFFVEQGLQPQIEEQGAFVHFRAEAIELWCGDFFALTAADVEQCHLFYDRAALIALPLEMRQRYAAHLQAILPQVCRGLLVTLDYPQEQMNGPPFAVPAEQVQAFYAEGWDVSLLAREDVLGENWRFLQRGLTRLEESVFSVHRR